MGGHDIRNLTLTSLRGQIAAVPQDLTLFNESIYYNIAYGREGATEEEVYRAARRAAIDTQVCCELENGASRSQRLMQPIMPCCTVHKLAAGL